MPTTIILSTDEPNILEKAHQLAKLVFPKDTIAVSRTTLHIADPDEPLRQWFCDELPNSIDMNEVHLAQVAYAAGRTPRAKLPIKKEHKAPTEKA